MDYTAIYNLYPNAVTLRGGVAYDINDNEVTYDKAAVEAYVASQAYIAKRQAEYPPIADYLDGIVKGDQSQIDKYIADCHAVKLKYPKGT